MTKHIYPLKPCPWCNKTPKFHMYLDDITWVPTIGCHNMQCSVKPKSNYIPIRKKQKKDPHILKIKIEKLIGFWNDENPLIATEGIELDFNSIANNEQLLN